MCTCAYGSSQRTPPAPPLSCPHIFLIPKTSSAFTSPCQCGIWTVPHISDAPEIPSPIVLTPVGGTVPLPRCTTLTLWLCHQPPFSIIHTCRPPPKSFSASLADLCTRLSLESCACLLRYANVYVDGFVALAQGNPVEQRQI